MALQALALYSTLVFSPTGSSTVTVQAPSAQLVFDVNQDNKLLYQEKTLQDLEGTINLEAKGSMCASVQVQDNKISTLNLHTCLHLYNSFLDFFCQISLHYNIPPPTDMSSFSVKVQPECRKQKNRVTLTLTSL